MVNACRTFALILLGASACTTALGIDGEYALRDPDSGAEDGVTTGAEANSSDDAGGGNDASGDRTIGLSDGRASDAAVAVDARDAGCVNGHICNGVCLSGKSCDTCATAKVFCAATNQCVSACSSCGAAATECWTCPGGGGAVGTCEPTTTAYCLGGAYDHCGCEAGLVACPGSLQTCPSGGVCKQCGEPGSDGRSCRGGATCEQVTGSCQ